MLFVHLRGGQNKYCKICVGVNFKFAKSVRRMKKTTYNDNNKEEVIIWQSGLLKFDSLNLITECKMWCLNKRLLDDDTSIWNNFVYVFENNIPQCAPMWAELTFVRSIYNWPISKQILGRLYWSVNAVIAGYMSCTFII